MVNLSNQLRNNRYYLIIFNFDYSGEKMERIKGNVTYDLSYFGLIIFSVIIIAAFSFLLRYFL